VRLGNSVVTPFFRPLAIGICESSKLSTFLIVTKNLGKFFLLNVLNQISRYKKIH